MKLQLQVNWLDSRGLFQSLRPDSPATENLGLLYPDSSEAVKKFLHKGHIYFPAIKQFSCLSSLVVGYIDPYIMYGKELTICMCLFPFLLAWISSGLEGQLLYVWAKLVVSSLASCLAQVSRFLTQFFLAPSSFWLLKQWVCYFLKHIWLQSKLNLKRTLLQHRLIFVSGPCLLLYQISSFW